MPVPISGVIQQYDGFFDVNFMRLKILNQDTAIADNMETGWLINQLLLENNGRKTHGLIGSHRTLMWEEGPIQFQLWAKKGFTRPENASPTEEPPITGSLDEMRNLRDEGTLLENRQEGDVKLHDAINVTWLMGRANKEQKLKLEMSWDCPANLSEFIRYRLSASLPDPGQGDWANTLQSFTSRFRCY